MFKLKFASCNGPVKWEAAFTHISTRRGLRDSMLLCCKVGSLAADRLNNVAQL